MGGYTITVRNQPTRSTQPCIPPGLLNRVPASAGVNAGMSPLAGCDPIWHVNSSSGVATSVSELLYPCYFTLLYFTCVFGTHCPPSGPHACRCWQTSEFCDSLTTGMHLCSFCSRCAVNSSMMTMLFVGRRRGVERTLLCVQLQRLRALHALRPCTSHRSACC